MITLESRLPFVRLVVFLAAFYGCSRGPGTEQLDKDIAEVDKQLQEVLVDKKALAGLAGVFALSREQILLNSRAMLEQKRKAWIRSIDLEYSVDGAPYKRPDDFKERLRKLEESILEEKVSVKQAEASGDAGLFGVLGQMGGSIAKLNLVLLESQKRLLENDIPAYELAQYQGLVKSGAAETHPLLKKSAKVSNEKKGRPQTDPASRPKPAAVLKLLGFKKERKKAGFTETMTLTLTVKNMGETRIKAWKARMLAKNSFGEVLFQANLSSDSSSIPPAEVEDAPFQWENNPFMENEIFDKLAATSDENLSIELSDEKIVGE